MSVSNIIPPEILFSSWAFVWVILYVVAEKLGLTEKQNPLVLYFNPTVAILLSLAFQVLAVLVIFLCSDPRKIPVILVKLVLVTIVFKLAPFLLIYRASRIPWKESAISFVVVFLAYLVFIFSRGLNPISIYIDLLTSIAKDDDRIPPYYWANQIMRSVSQRSS